MVPGEIIRMQKECDTPACRPAHGGVLLRSLRKRQHQSRAAARRLHHHPALAVAQGRILHQQEPKPVDNQRIASS